MPPELTAERLRDVLSYDPKTGDFRWLLRSSKKNRIGQVAGSARPDGYRQIKIDGIIYFSHRLAFLYLNGKTPEFTVDHIDRNPSNNRWENLREASSSDNGGNTGRYRTNTSGFKGVTWHKASRKWQAQIGVRGKHFYLGQFSSLEDAHAAYVAAALTHFGEFANDGLAA